MRTLTIIASMALAGCSASRPYAYNYLEKRMESTIPGDQLTLNIYDKEWRYAQPNAQPKFNYFIKKWEIAR